MEKGRKWVKWIRKNTGEGNENGGTRVGEGGGGGKRRRAGRVRRCSGVAVAVVVVDGGEAHDGARRSGSTVETDELTTAVSESQNGAAAVQVLDCRSSGDSCSALLTSCWPHFRATRHAQCVRSLRPIRGQLTRVELFSSLDSLLCAAHSVPIPRCVSRQTCEYPSGHHLTPLSCSERFSKLGVCVWKFSRYTVWWKAASSHGWFGGSAGRRQLPDGHGKEQVHSSSKGEQENHPSRSQVKLQTCLLRRHCGDLFFFSRLLSVRSVTQKYLEKINEVTFEKIFNQRLGGLLFSFQHVCHSDQPLIASFQATYSSNSSVRRSAWSQFHN